MQALYLNCPQLEDLNLNSCKNLHPERLLLQCPSLRTVHASDCKELVVGAIRIQLDKAAAPEENLLSCKRLADGSKRIRVPPLINSQASQNYSLYPYSALNINMVVKNILPKSELKLVSLMSSDNYTKRRRVGSHQCNILMS
ncbi:F-box/LRR-repeat protein 17, partial [Cucurbita argyrosperma subsp. argyrosperma]